MKKLLKFAFQFPAKIYFGEKEVEIIAEKMVNGYHLIAVNANIWYDTKKGKVAVTKYDVAGDLTFLVFVEDYYVRVGLFTESLGSIEDRFAYIEGKLENLSKACRLMAEAILNPEKYAEEKAIEIADRKAANQAAEEAKRAKEKREEEKAFELARYNFSHGHLITWEECEKLLKHYCITMHPQTLGHARKCVQQISTENAKVKLGSPRLSVHFWDAIKTLGEVSQYSA